MKDLEKIRGFGFMPNPDFEINKIKPIRDEFVYVLRIEDNGEMEVHMPIGWVSLDDGGKITFNGEGQRVLHETEARLGR